MLTLAPQKNVLVDLKLNNPSDGGTYYVRAVIKDAVTDETIETLDLTDQGDKYFSKLWQTPADPSGQGRQLSVFKTVYDDSGYTTESAVYGTVHETWLISQAALGNPNAGYGGIDYRAIKELMDEAVKDIPRDFSPLLGAIGGSHKTVMSKLKERIEGLLNLEKKAVDIERLDKSVREGAATLKESAATIGDALEAFKKAANAAIKAIAKAAEFSEKRIEGKFDEEMTRAVGVLRDNVELASERISKAVTDSSEQMLRTPVRINMQPQGEMRARIEREMPEKKEAPRGLERFLA